MCTSDITVTAAAEKFMRRMVRFSEAPAGGFRLSVAPGGCSGLSSSFTVEAGPQPGDAEMSVNGLRLFLAPGTSQLLTGATMDFVDAPTQSGLVFHRPGGNTCACSSSAVAAAATAVPAQATVALDSIRRRAHT